jgi:Domain of unknown function (DUF397)
MRSVHNGMPATELRVTRWQKSSFSGTSNCVEMAPLPTGEIALRNSRDPDGPALICTRSEIDALLRGARNGDFDALVSLTD